MSTILELRAEVDDAMTLKLISQAFTEAAASKVQKIKDAFEQNRQFYEDISRVYHVVQASGEKLQLHAKKQKVKEKKTLSVAVTSNQRFYGNINISIMQEFMSRTENQTTQLVVIGATGRDFLKSKLFERSYESILFKKDNPTLEESRAFLDKVGGYDQVFVYFPKFVTLMTQTVGVMDICQAAQAGETDSDQEFDILFEPEYSQILSFFQKQVQQLLFVRVMMEADLSRTAARMISMSGAEDRSNEIIKIKRLELRKLQTTIVNAKLLETFAALKGVRKN